MKRKRPPGCLRYIGRVKTGGAPPLFTTENTGDPKNTAECQSKKRLAKGKTARVLKAGRRPGKIRERWLEGTKERVLRRRKAGRSGGWTTSLNNFSASQVKATIRRKINRLQGRKSKVDTRDWGGNEYFLKNRALQTY